MRKGGRHLIPVAAGLCTGLLLLALASIPLAAPTLAAAACPGCYGMQRIADHVYVDRAMPDGEKAALLAHIAAADATLARFFGALEGNRTVLGCSQDRCEKQLAGWLEGTHSVRGFSYHAGPINVVRLAPTGQNAVIVAHELTHVEIHARIGFLNHMDGAFPAWFDEGLATLISNDRRYFKPGATAAARCLPTPPGDLPTRPFGWTEAIGAKPWIYAAATCRVMGWMEANGGRDAVLAVMAKVAAGEPFVP